MFFLKFDRKRGSHVSLNLKIAQNIPKKLFSVIILSWLIVINPASVLGEEKTNNANLPTAPDTGTPEEDFQSAGTRDNETLSSLCQADSQQIVYLLGENIRESTLSPYPVFWFNFANIQAIGQIEFVLEETDTNKKVYHRTLKTPKQTGTLGIALPHQKKYALIANKNYSWKLNIDCVGEPKTLALTGWLHRLLPDTKLQNQLATASDEEKYHIYLKRNLLYDALNELAQRRTHTPQDIKLVTAWNQLLQELGWHNLAQQSTVEFHVLQTDIEYK